MKKRISKILAVLLAVCMMPIPFASLPVSAAADVDYETVVSGELLYKVNFNGDDNMSALTQGWDKNMTITPNGASVDLKVKSGKWSNAGAQLNGLDIQGGAYTFIFTVTASDNDEEVGFVPDHQTGFVVNPGQNKVRYTDHLNWADNDLDTVDVIEPITYKGTGSLTQTYAVEVAGEGEGKNSKGQPYVDITAYNIYNLIYDGEGNAVWNLACSLTEDQLSSFFFDWGDAGNCDGNVYARFSRDRKNYSSANNGTITVSNFFVYEGLAVTNTMNAEEIEPIYDVNFNGNDGVFKYNEDMYDGMGVRTVTDEGRTIELAATKIPSDKGSVWSGEMLKYKIPGNSYTVVFTVDAPDNQSVGIFFKYRDGFFVNPMNNTYSVGYCGNDGHNVEKYVGTTTYNGSGKAKQTYAIEFASGSVAGSDKKYNCSAYRLWVQNIGKWQCIAELSADVREEIAWNETDYEFMIQLARVSDGKTNTGSVKVSDAKVYRGLVASKFENSQIYYQLTKDNSNLRIIGAVDFTEEELKNYANLGFNVTMTFEGKSYTNTFTTTTVYTSLIADGKTIYANEYGNYFFAVEITDLEFAAAEDVVFQVDGFATKLDETVENVLGSKKIKIDGDPLSILPTFTGYSFEDTDTGDDCYMRSFGAVDYSDFDDYCDDIAENGFELYAEKTLENNVYRTYANKRYVVTTIYTGYNRYGKVLVEPRVGTALPTKAEDNVYTPIAGMDTTITQVGLYDGDLGETYNGMCYIVRLADGIFIVVDGGFAREGSPERIYDVLRKQAPDPDNIVIAAWMITHAHDDHVDVFESFFEAYGDKVTVEKFICNLPSDAQTGDVWTKDIKWMRYKQVRAVFEEYCSDIPVVKAHPGQEFYIRNVKIDILYTVDIFDLNHSKLEDFNNTSVVFKLTAEGKSMIFLGDYDDDAYTMKKLYTASTLNSDIVQMAHHGLASYSSKDLYPMITPTYVFWPIGAKVIKDGSEDVYNGTQNKWIIQNCDEENIYLAEDNVYVFNMKTCECVKYDTVAKYVASK